jgi:hypothetical protein
MLSVLKMFLDCVLRFMFSILGLFIVLVVIVLTVSQIQLTI